MRCLVALLIAPLLLVACESGPVDPSEQTVTVSLGEPAVVDASGGTLVTPDEEVSLSFPEGALQAEVPITISAVPASVPGLDSWSTAVELGPDGTTFDAPVTLSLAVDPAALPAGVPVAALRIFTYGEAGWEEVPGSTVSGQTITAEIQHFSARSEEHTSE